MKKNKYIHKTIYGDTRVGYPPHTRIHIGKHLPQPEVVKTVNCPVVFENETGCMIFNGVHEEIIRFYNSDICQGRGRLKELFQRMKNLPENGYLDFERWGFNVTVHFSEEGIPIGKIEDGVTLCMKTKTVIDNLLKKEMDVTRN
jgi:hypothetical protein